MGTTKKFEIFQTIFSFVISPKKKESCIDFYTYRFYIKMVFVRRIISIYIYNVYTIYSADLFAF